MRHGRRRLSTVSTIFALGRSARRAFPQDRPGVKTGTSLIRRFRFAQGDDSTCVIDRVGVLDQRAARVRGFGWQYWRGEGFPDWRQGGSGGGGAFGKRAGRFGTGQGNRTQQELGEMGEGGGFLTRDAALREKAKDLSEGAVHAGGGGEVAGGGKEFGEIERSADGARAGFAEELIFAFGVETAERRVDIGPRHSALAAVGEGELAAAGQRVCVNVDVFMCQKRRDGHALLALDNLMIVR